MTKTCSRCLYRDLDSLYEPCYSCLLDIERLPNFTMPFDLITNGDRIRSMTDEELADLFVEMGERCVYHGFTEHNCDVTCKQCWVDWLKQEHSKIESVWKGRNNEALQCEDE